MASIKLSSVPTGSVFIDSESTYDGFPVSWQVVAHDTDGEGITTLIMERSVLWADTAKLIYYPFDAQEPTNPDTTAQENGNYSYAYSNILQYLNSDGLAGEWYTAQHEYDQAPTSDYIETGSYPYANKDAFLANFSEKFKENMVAVTKCGVSRKVHIPSVEEINPRTNVETDSTASLAAFDTGEAYLTYNWRVTKSEEKESSINPGAQVRNAVSSTATRLPVVGVKIFVGSETLPVVTKKGSGYPYDSSRQYLPMIFLNSNATVEYNSTKNVYYAAFNTKPVITPATTDIGVTKADTVVTFQVSDADSDVIVSNIYVDSTENEPVYTNSSTPLDTNVSYTFPQASLEELTLGAHKFIITAEDTYDHLVSVEVSFTRVEASAPVITVSDLGKITYEAFNITYMVSDPDGDSVDIDFYFDSTDNKIGSQSNVTLDTTLTFSVTSSMLPTELGIHKLIIVATDSSGAYGEAKSTVIFPTSPTIEVDSTDYGDVVSPFNIPFTVYDLDGDSYTVKAYLDSTSRELEVYNNG